MKLRIRGNSLRLRLSQSEVARIAAGERVEDAIAFGPGARLLYALVPSRDATSPGARFVANEITVTLSNANAQAWATGSDVGIEGDQEIGDGERLRILVEKDFACLKPRADEDDSDAYANPSTTC